jgi:hypothetical protein
MGSTQFLLFLAFFSAGMHLINSLTDSRDSKYTMFVVVLLVHTIYICLPSLSLSLYIYIHFDLSP